MLFLHQHKRQIRIRLTTRGQALAGSRIPIQQDAPVATMTRSVDSELCEMRQYPTQQLHRISIRYALDRPSPEKKRIYNPKAMNIVMTIHVLLLIISISIIIVIIIIKRQGSSRVQNNALRKPAERTLQSPAELQLTLRHLFSWSFIHEHARTGRNNLQHKLALTLSSQPRARPSLLISSVWAMIVSERRTVMHQP